MNLKKSLVILVSTFVLFTACSTDNKNEANNQSKARELANEQIKESLTLIDTKKEDLLTNFKQRQSCTKGNDNEDRSLGKYAYVEIKGTLNKNVVRKKTKGQPIKDTGCEFLVVFGGGSETRENISTDLYGKFITFGYNNDGSFFINTDTDKTNIDPEIIKTLNPTPIEELEQAQQ